MIFVSLSNQQFADNRNLKKDLLEAKDQKVALENQLEH